MIDVIIPLYNAKDTLEKTLISLDLQTIKEHLKIYLIDDSGVDNYDAIINNFSSLNIVYHRLNENKGPGLARQEGIQISNGEYITFIDADDYLYDADSMRFLFDGIKEGYDYVSGYTFDEKRYLNINNPSDLHGKIYRRSFLEKNNIKFNETRFHEDNYFNNLVLMLSPKIKELEYCVYIYRYNKKSITNLDHATEFLRLEILIYNLYNLILEGLIRNCNHELIYKVIFDKVCYFNTVYHNMSIEQQKQFIIWLGKYSFNIQKYLDLDIKKINLEDLKKDINLQKIKD